jgi:hypothetical protein
MVKTTINLTRGNNQQGTIFEGKFASLSDIYYHTLCLAAILWAMDPTRSGEMLQPEDSSVKERRESLKLHTPVLIMASALEEHMQCVR